MPVVIEDCHNLFNDLAARFPLLQEKTAGQPERLDPPRGTTAAFLVRTTGIVQPLVFVFFPHEHEGWLAVARETFRFEGECWRRWIHATHDTSTDVGPFHRHEPPPVWTGLDEQRSANGDDLIGLHEATIGHLDRQRTFPALVRPYIPWTPLSVSGSLAPMRRQIEEVVAPIVRTGRRPLDDAIPGLDGSHVLVQHAHLVPTRWRDFHERYFALGLSRTQRGRRTFAAPPVPAQRSQR